MVYGLAATLFYNPEQASESAMELVESFRATLPEDSRGTALVSAEIPTVACLQDGQMGLQEPPALPKTLRLIVPTGKASLLAYYTANPTGRFGVLGPRGWTCHATLGSSGGSLYVLPPDAPSGDPEATWKGASYHPGVRRWGNIRTI